MTSTTTQPRLTQDGILFSVTVESVRRNCVVTRDALQTLSQLKSMDDAGGGLLGIFHAYEAKISGVARRLVGARVAGNPLLMNKATFSAPHTD
ncbi:DUF1488 family protein [Noviherbaspirillum aridicola]|uniref:DUF1488 family protein n=1 Tax=Noviherbaspirillum aridicola TaxID=2849687 RepID=A0ABQ4Q0I8_9BURK|nr:DUF1488 family protein [Noviherbaspirillum aridicola]GIZ50269.1 hypothetical protein NCCP691_02830 [Noviherbaspirillum aridicola]